MSFLQPMALWAGVLLVPLVAVYFLKIRPTRKPTPTLFLWEQIFKESETSALLRRLRDLWSLLLMIAVVGAIVLGMARLTWTSKQDRRNLVILIDNSASMSSREGGKTRLEQAKRIAADIFDAMDMNGRGVLGSVSDDIEMVTGLTSNQRTLIEGLDKISASDCPFRLDRVVSLLKDNKLGDDRRVILISDGCFQGADELSGVQFLKVGKPAENIGVVAFDMLPVGGNGNKLQLYFQLASSYAENRSVDVLVCRDDPENIVKICPVQVKPGMNAPELFTIEGGGAGRWILRLDVNDDLEKDNIAYGVVPAPKPVPVKINADKGGFFFTQCVGAFSQNESMMLLNADKAELLLSSGRAVSAEAAKCHIVFKSQGTSAFWKRLGPGVTVSAMRTKLADHEAIRFCDLEAIRFEGAVKIEPPEGSIILAETLDGVPLIYKTSSKGHRALVVNMDPDQSELFLNPYFPVMLYSMAQYLTGNSNRPPTTVCPAAAIQVAAEEDQSQDTPKYVRPKRLGFHTYKTERGEVTVGCSLVSSAESLLNAKKVEESSLEVQRGQSLSAILLIVALAVAAVESVMYHRRKVG